MSSICYLTFLLSSYYIYIQYILSRFLDIWMIVVFIYPFTIILAHTALHVLHHKQGTWVKPLATWILRSGVGYLDTLVRCWLPGYSGQVYY